MHDCSGHADDKSLAELKVSLRTCQEGAHEVRVGRTEARSLCNRTSKLKARIVRHVTAQN